MTNGEFMNLNAYRDKVQSIKNQIKSLTDMITGLKIRDSGQDGIISIRISTNRYSSSTSMPLHVFRDTIFPALDKTLKNLHYILETTPPLEHNQDSVQGE